MDIAAVGTGGRHAGGFYRQNRLRNRTRSAAAVRSQIPREAREPCQRYLKDVRLPLRFEFPRHAMRRVVA
jgi:hypothetical protein